MAALIDWRARPLRTVRHHMALVEAAVAEYARALWEQAAPHRLRWLRHVLRKLRPLLSRLAVRTFEPDEVLLEQYIRQFSVDYSAPDLTGVLEELGQKIAVQYGFLPSDPRAERLEREFRKILEGDLFTYWRGLTDPRRLARRLADLRRQNQSTQRIIEQLQLEYAADYFTAERVVRTLYTAGANNAQLAALKAHGYTHKRWLTARDNRVRVAQGSSRFDHRQMDGVVVPIDEPFVTPAGSRLLYPGDRSLGAPPGEVMNCRCTVVGVVLGNESAHPSRGNFDAPAPPARPRNQTWMPTGSPWH